MAISDNPTKTRTLEKNWYREINRRWGQFASESIKDLKGSNDLVSNTEFRLTASAVQDYILRFDQRIIQLLTGLQAPNWQSKHQVQAYARGVQDFIRKLDSQGVEITLEMSLLEQKELGLVSEQDFNAVVHREALAFLTDRSFESLKRWTDSMTTETKTILNEAIVNGDSLEKVISDIRSRISVSRSRARVIAATEINQAYSRAIINEANLNSERLGEPVNLRWLTVRDSKVRHLHAEFHGQIMTPEEAAKNKAISPWNCRCGWAPVVGEQTEAQKERFSEQRETLLELEAGAKKA